MSALTRMTTGLLALKRTHSVPIALYHANVSRVFSFIIHNNSYCAITYWIWHAAGFGALREPAQRRLVG